MGSCRSDNAKDVTKLSHDARVISVDAGARVSQDELALDGRVVVLDGVLVADAEKQVNAAVNLHADRYTVRWADERGVEVAPAAATICSTLADRTRQVMSTAEPQELDLGQRICAAA